MEETKEAKEFREKLIGPQSKWVKKKGVVTKLIIVKDKWPNCPECGETVRVNYNIAGCRSYLADEKGSLNHEGDDVETIGLGSVYCTECDFTFEDADSVVFED